METLTFGADKAALENQLFEWDTCAQVLRNTTRIAYAEELAENMQSKRPTNKGWIFTKIWTDRENGQNVYKVLGRRDKLKLLGITVLSSGQPTIATQQIVFSAKVLECEKTENGAAPDWYIVDRASVVLLSQEEPELEGSLA